MEVGGTYLFLYGVYSNSANARGVKAAVFLERCPERGRTFVAKLSLIPKTTLRPESGFCEDISINNILVERGYSDRAALE